MIHGIHMMPHIWYCSCQSIELFRRSIVVEWGSFMVELHWSYFKGGTALCAVFFHKTDDHVNIANVSHPSSTALVSKSGSSGFRLPTLIWEEIVRENVNIMLPFQFDCLAFELSANRLRCLWILHSCGKSLVFECDSHWEISVIFSI